MRFGKKPSPKAKIMIATSHTVSVRYKENLYSSYNSIKAEKDIFVIFRLLEARSELWVL